MAYLFMMILFLYIGNNQKGYVAGAFYIISLVAFVKRFTIHPMLFGIITAVFVVLIIIGMNDGEAKRKKEFNPDYSCTKFLTTDK